ncbi:hydroxyacid dehydrogenase [Paucibacter sp. KBW04]|uniref:2-hydroxyacid dehydrogenase n=1 Tax=Paucibacter sp. KBW04 TaxID=2153361 RepID=UPI000F55D74E|nr:2-hydroxyacid dehydrogenase [Paucibacter sp. KBW04]RQO62557.1 hydroxyacid dehydrogenase [Paucibacter sp. KBW04]
MPALANPASIAGLPAPSSAKPTLLILIPLQAEFEQRLAQRYQLISAPGGFDADLQSLLADLRARGQGVQAVLSNGTRGLSRAQMLALGAGQAHRQGNGLGIVCAFGAGYEAIDVAAARELGVAVTHAPGINNATVADHALALMLGLARGIVGLDRAVKAGAWLSSRAERPTLNGRRLGLVGMGNIGQQIARRALGFDMSVAYHSRLAKPDLPYRFHADLLALAEASDYLVLACPGGPATHHMVTREVLRRLGPQGYLINIARGSVVRTADLIAALQAGEIAGAGLDVLEDEPLVPPELAALDQVLLTPHISGRSPEAQRAQLACLMTNLSAFFEAQVLPNPVPV